MQRIKAEQIEQRQRIPNINENVPTAILSTCPHCTNTPVPFIINWVPLKTFADNTIVTTHITGRSTCGFCKKQVYLIHLAEQNATVLKVASSTYMLPEPPVGRSFSENINKLSPDFVTIYQQAAKAEALDLDQIAGPGYRKALEFLVKDYLISTETGDQSEKDEIASRGLHRCITSIDNAKLQAAATAAKLVGNDESHYVKGEVHDIEDLKRFISITLHWLEIELETQELIGGSSTP